jgi:hypothetical protein
MILTIKTIFFKIRMFEFESLNTRISHRQTLTDSEFVGFGGLRGILWRVKVYKNIDALTWSNLV